MESIDHMVSEFPSVCFPFEQCRFRDRLRKFPLLQLVVSFPRPPLSFMVECLVILHLLGDPIDTIKNLCLKMSVCQQIAEFWKPDCGILLDRRMDHDEDHEQDLEDRDWKALTIVTDAYGEWSEDTSAQHILHTAL